MSMESPFSQSDRSFAAPQQSTFSRPMSLEPEPKPCGIPASYPSLCGSNGRLYTVTVASYGSYIVHQGIIPQQFAHEGHVCLLWVHSLIYMQHYSWWRYMSHVIIFTVYIIKLAYCFSVLYFGYLYCPFTCTAIIIPLFLQWMKLTDDKQKQNTTKFCVCLKSSRISHVVPNPRT